MLKLTAEGLRAIEDSQFNGMRTETIKTTLMLIAVDLKEDIYIMLTNEKCMVV